MKLVDYQKFKLRFSDFTVPLCQSSVVPTNTPVYIIALNHLPIPPPLRDGVVVFRFVHCG